MLKKIMSSGVANSHSFLCLSRIWSLPSERVLTDAIAGDTLCGMEWGWDAKAFDTEPSLFHGIVEHSNFFDWGMMHGLALPSRKKSTCLIRPCGVFDLSTFAVELYSALFSMQSMSWNSSF